MWFRVIRHDWATNTFTFCSPSDLFFTLPCSSLNAGQLIPEGSRVFWLLEFSSRRSWRQEGEENGDVRAPLPPSLPFLQQAGHLWGSLLLPRRPTWSHLQPGDLAPRIYWQAFLPLIFQPQSSEGFQLLFFSRPNLASWFLSLLAQ